MPRYIASYDLKNTTPSPYGPFIEAAEDNGWTVWIKAAEGEWNRLPNTTLIGDFDDIDAAVSALKQTRTDASKVINVDIKMPKWIVSERKASKFVSDETMED